MTLQRHSEADLAAEQDGSDGAELARALSVGGFFVRAPRRRPRLAAGALLAGGAVTMAIALLAPREYATETKILVRRDVVIQVLGNPRRPVPSDWDLPGRGLSESVLRRDNLVTVIEETGLRGRWSVGRSPILKLKDTLAASVLGPPSPEDTVRALVGMLDKRLSVRVEDTTIKISASWHDPETAYRLVSCVERSLLKDRITTETAAITDTITILEEEASRQRDTIDAALAKAQKPQAAAAPHFRRASAPRVDKPTDELAEKHRAVQAAEEVRQRRLGELRAQLAELRITYAAAHPLVLAMEEKIRQASADPPELVELRRAEETLLSRIKSYSPRSGVREDPSDPLAAVQRAALGGMEREDDPEVAAAKASLFVAVQRYEELKDRIDSARMELHTAQAASKYRYVVVEPAELPTKPTKPSTVRIVVGGLAISIVLAFALAGAVELASGRFIEPWQVRSLPIPVLGEVEWP